MVPESHADTHPGNLDSPHTRPGAVERRRFFVTARSGSHGSRLLAVGLWHLSASHPLSNSSNTLLLSKVWRLSRPAAFDELPAVVNLSDIRNRPLGGFSGGMHQRVGIAQALLNDPQLLIVDEPTAGLDPEERVRYRNLLSELSGERIVILSTHIVSDVEAVATDIAILAHGQLLAHDSPESLLAAISGKVWGNHCFQRRFASSSTTTPGQQHGPSRRRRKSQSQPRLHDCTPLARNAASSRYTYRSILSLAR